MEEVLRHFCFFQLDIVNTLKLKLFHLHSHLQWQKQKHFQKSVESIKGLRENSHFAIGKILQRQHNSFLIFFTCTFYIGHK